MKTPFLSEPAVPALDSRVAIDVTDLERARLVFRHEINEEAGGFYYARRAQPTVERLLRYIREIQHADWAVGTSSGMAAADLLLHAIVGAERRRAVRPLVAFGDGIYYEVERLIRARAEILSFDWLRLCTTNIESFKKAFATIAGKAVSLVWLESPANPLLGLTDIEAVAGIVRASAPDALVAVDNSALPVFQRSLDHGADLEVISLTKFVNGMGDAMGGCILTNNTTLAETLRTENDAAGAVLSASAAHTIANNVTTLHLRMSQHCANAAAVASSIEDHPAVSRVYYPLLSKSSVGLVAKQMRGFGGGIVSLQLRGGYDAGERLMRAIIASRDWNPAQQRPSTLYIIPTFGMPSTNVEHYYSFIRHREGLPRDATSEGAIVPGFCRVAVGLAAANDISADLLSALDASLASS